MKLSTDIQEGRLIVTVHADKLDAPGAIQFRQQIDEIDFSTGDAVILDLSKIRFMDSSGVWALTHLYKVSNDWSLMKLISNNLVVQQLLHATGLSQFIEIYPTVADAIAPRQSKAPVSIVSTMFNPLLWPLRRFGNRETTSSQTA